MVFVTGEWHEHPHLAAECGEHQDVATSRYGFIHVSDGYAVCLIARPDKEALVPEALGVRGILLNVIDCTPNNLILTGDRDVDKTSQPPTHHPH